jgi:uncharacterized spore protein YtfJ
MAKPPAEAVPTAQRLLARMTGARLCFGRPVAVGARTVIPVASVRTAGGFGLGNDAQSGQTAGAGGGGAIDARPVGFIEIGPDGTRFERIDDGRMALRAIAAGSIAVLVVGRVLTRNRRITLARPLNASGRRRGRGKAIEPHVPPPPAATPKKRGLLAQLSQRS